jgi:hypothetical protein
MAQYLGPLAQLNHNRTDSQAPMNRHNATATTYPTWVS